MTQQVRLAEAELADRYRRLYTSLVSDCIEELGFGARCLSAGLAPYHPDQLRVAVGRAHTGYIRRTAERVEIDRLLEMVQATPPASVVVVATDPDFEGAAWGGLMSAAAGSRGAVGAVVAGGVRDLHQIHPLGFAVWARYRSPADIRGRGELVCYGEPVDIHGVRVSPGELVVADANGVVVVPAGAEVTVLERCEDRLGRERATEDELRAGSDPRETYDRYGAF
jgi:4-hydroxy-4-methyl-2-oxoglutarate aldolase